MVQGVKKLGGGGRPASAGKRPNSAKVTQKAKKAMLAKKGNPLALCKGRFRDHALDDKALSKAIMKSSEQKVAAKLIQGGGKLKNKDLLEKGKDLNRETKRKMVKRKVGRVEEKLKALTAKAEKDGLI